jgi:hypothetical protein
MSCFPLGKMTGLTFSQLQKYSYAVSVFKRIEAYNLGVSINRTRGNLSQAYYEFIDSYEQAQYTQGLFLLVQNDPSYANYIPVQKI